MNADEYPKAENMNADKSPEVTSNGEVVKVNTDKMSESPIGHACPLDVNTTIAIRTLQRTGKGKFFRFPLSGESSKDYYQYLRDTLANFLAQRTVALLSTRHEAARLFSPFRARVKAVITPIPVDVDDLGKPGTGEVA